MKRWKALASLFVLSGLLFAALGMVLRGAQVQAAARIALAAAGDVVINEVAWAGHSGYTSDEWIELYNNTDQDVSLAGWTLVAGDGVPSVNLSGTIAARGYYLIERDDDNTVSDVAADWTGSFGGALSNTGETLTLRDAGSNVVDTANANGGAWPAGATYYSMERINPALVDSDANWASNDGAARNGLDAGGNPINGTPRTRNSCYVSPQAELAVAKSGPASAVPGSTIVYHLSVTNSGTLSAAGLRMTDTLPGSVSYVTQSNSCGLDFSPIGSHLVWTSTVLGVGAGCHVTLTAQVGSGAAGNLTNVVTATTTSSETVTGNNVDDWATSVVVAYTPLDVVINEVAWAGHSGYTSDEWIELHNNTTQEVSLAGWTLVSGDGGPNLSLAGSIPARGYYLIERDDDNTVSDVAAGWTGSFGSGLSNTGEVLTLRDAASNVIDTANGDGGAWPAGAGSPSYASMERINPTLADAGANWCTNDSVTRNGLDAGGSPINGTPRAQNSCYVTPRPDLHVSKIGTALVQPGGPITYTVGVRNVGTAMATGVVITDLLPAEVSFVSQASSAGFSFDTPSAGLLVWQVGDLAPSAEATIWITGHVPDGVLFAFTNHVTATTAVSEVTQDNNTAAWQAAPDVELVYLPIVFRTYTPPRYGVVVEALHYDGLQASDYDEAVLIVNGGDRPVDVSGWDLCKWDSPTLAWKCADLPAVTIASHQRLWLARRAADFRASFGFDPDYVLATWPNFNNDGDEVVLRDASGAVRDALVYEGGTQVEGWSGTAVQPYAGSNFSLNGQILYRYLSEKTGLPFDDTGTAADWAQYTGNAQSARRVRYPGWDLERFFRPAVGSSGTVTAAVAPDNAYPLVVNTIRAARHSLELELYTLDHYGLVNELVQRASAGVSVTVLLEGGPVGGIDSQELWACERLHSTGHGVCYFMVNTDTLRIYDRYTYLHAKFMLVDRQRVLIGSQNFTPTGLPGDDKSNGTGGSRGVVLVTDAPEIVARAVEIFEADCDAANHTDISMWGPGNVLGYGAPPPGFIPDTGSDWVTYTVQFPQPLQTTGSSFELVTSPESSLRSSDALLGLVARAGAGDAVYVEQMYEYPDWGNDPASAPNLRLEAYIAAARRGAMVRILLNGGNFGNENITLTDNVAAAGYVNGIAQAEGLQLSAHLSDPTAYGIHNKMVLVDLGAEGKYVHVGSINGSEGSSKVNREMALQVRSTALFDYLYSVFSYDWNVEPPLRHVLITEVMYNTSAGGEWVEIYNPTAEAVDLSGWHLGDAGEVGEYGSGQYRFPTGTLLPAGGVIVVAQQAADVVGFTPDFEFLIDPYRNTAAVPDMVPVGSWSGFGFALGNAGDEVILLNATAARVDAVTYGTGSYPGVIPHPGVSGTGHSLERRPPEQDSDDCSQDFFDRFPATPGALPD